MNKIKVGATITLLNEQTNREIIVRLDQETKEYFAKDTNVYKDISEGDLKSSNVITLGENITTGSEIGKELLGKSVGDRISHINSKGITVIFKIIKVENI